MSYTQTLDVPQDELQRLEQLLEEEMNDRVPSVLATYSAVYSDNRKFELLVQDATAGPTLTYRLISADGEELQSLELNPGPLEGAHSIEHQNQKYTLTLWPAGPIAGSLTDKLKKTYIKNGGTRCPYCKSADIDPSIPRTSSDVRVIRSTVTCTRCNAEWGDIFTLSDVEEYTPPAND